MTGKNNWIYLTNIVIYALMLICTKGQSTVHQRRKQLLRLARYIDRPIWFIQEFVYIAHWFRFDSTLALLCIAILCYFKYMCPIYIYIYIYIYNAPVNN